MLTVALGKESVMFKVAILIVVPELTLDKYDLLFSLVSPEKQERIKRFRNFQDAQNCLLGDILARVEICRATGFNNKQLEFTTNSYGKPCLTSNPQVYHNISHAGPYITCVIDDEPVGIDIELIKPIDMKIAKRFFAPNETTYILSAPNNIQIQRFFEIWTKKESRIKWEGTDLLKHLPSFNVLNTPKQSKTFYHRVYSNKKAICHVCSNKKETPSTRIINTNTLLQDIQQHINTQ